MRKLKSYQVSFPNTWHETRDQLQEEKCKTQRYKDTEQRATKQPIDERGNQTVIKHMKIHNFSKFKGCSKISYKRKVHSFTCLPWESRLQKNKQNPK